MLPSGSQQRTHPVARSRGQRRKFPLMDVPEKVVLLFHGDYDVHQILVRTKRDDDRGCVVREAVVLGKIKLGSPSVLRLGDGRVIRGRGFYEAIGIALDMTLGPNDPPRIPEDDDDDDDDDDEEWDEEDEDDEDEDDEDEDDE